MWGSFKTRSPVFENYESLEERFDAICRKAYAEYIEGGGSIDYETWLDNLVAMGEADESKSPNAV